MSEEKPEAPGIDIIKVYIWGMASLTLITFVWLLLNYYLLQRYKREWDRGVENLQELMEKEKQLPAQAASALEESRLENPFDFFTRTVRGLNETPPGPPHVGDWILENIEGVEFEERKYTIEFKKGPITRYHLARYIYTIQKEKDFLKVKEMTLWKAGEPHEDRWTAEIVFAQRKPK